MLGIVLSKQEIAENIIDLRVEAQINAPSPGRFLHISCGDGLLLRRPISLCDYQDGVARLIFAVKGEGTRWLARRTEGDRLDMLGALGNGFDLSDEPTLLVGGGLGVPPMLYCSRILKENAHAILGFRSKTLAYLHQEFPSYELYTDDGSLGKKGYPHEALERSLAEGKWKRVLTCGPLPMVRAVAQAAERNGVECYVSMEERMGCGVGACAVCACAVGYTYKRVCKDGPVFDSREVRWDG